MNKTEADNDNKAAHDKPKKYFPDQFDDEEVVFVFRKHPVVMRHGLIITLLGPLLGVLPSVIWPQIGFSWFFGGLAIGLAVGLIVFSHWWISWYFSVFVVTDQRFIEINQEGLFRRSVNDIYLSQIQAVSYDVAGIEQTLLGFGTIKMRGYIGEIIITKVHHPEKVKQQLFGLLRQQNPAPNSYEFNNESSQEA